MTVREAYIYHRLMELACMAETQPLEELEKQEERDLLKELTEIKVEGEVSN